MVNGMTQHGRKQGTRVGAVAALVLLLAGGCAQRHAVVTSEPAGATVFVNDVEVGRTPLKFDFTYYGVYDVRVEKAGFEPLRTKANANTPIDERMPVDLAAAALPFSIDHEVKWHFTLEPALEATQSAEQLEQGLLERAKEMQQRAGGDVAKR